MTHHRSTDGTPDPLDTWVVEVAVAADVAVPGGWGAGREAFIEWLWATLGDAGLAGVSEGAVDVEAATAAGLVASPRVLDEAGAPADRDWVGAIGDARLACWFGDEESAHRAVTAIAGVPGCRPGRVRREPAAGDGGDWRRTFAAVRVPGFGTIRPAWETGEPAVSASDATIFIEPGVGFGTGLHETTQLCLAAVKRWCDTGDGMARVLDFGAGSGVLGIAAAVLGAGHVDAVDVDGRVHGAIAANAARNGVAHLVAVSAALPRGEPYDLIVANIVADVLLRYADDLCAAVRRDVDGACAGRVVLSGLLAADVDRVAAAYAARLGTTPREAASGDWRSLAFETRRGGSVPCR